MRAYTQFDISDYDFTLIVPLKKCGNLRFVNYSWACANDFLDSCKLEKIRLLELIPL